MNRITFTFFCLLSLAALPARPAAANFVLDWNATAGAAAVASCISPDLNPLHESRMYAMMHIAIHDALNAIDRRSRPYVFDRAVSSSVSPEAAAAAAARDVLVAALSVVPTDPVCVPASLAIVENAYSSALAAIPAGDPKTQGIQLGQESAAAIIALRDGDGSDTPLVVSDDKYDPANVTAPGAYRYTPMFPIVFAPGWGNVTPFVLNHSSQFRASPPDRITSKAYTEDFNEVKSLGRATESTRTPEQTEIGRFWLESSPLAWNRLARGVATARGLGTWESARLFGLLNMAMADGYISSWETKFHYEFWRPVTAIHEADNDGNPDTEADPEWEPLQLTYPMPDHDSAHSVEGGAASAVLAEFFGRDDIAFEACSISLLPGSRCGDGGVVWRSYSSFSQAAEENAVSRIYVGIHFRRASEEGLQHGRKIGKRAVNLFMKPAP